MLQPLSFWDAARGREPLFASRAHDGVPDPRLTDEVAGLRRRGHGTDPR